MERGIYAAESLENLWDRWHRRARQFAACCGVKAALLVAMTNYPVMLARVLDVSARHLDVLELSSDVLERCLDLFACNLNVLARHRDGV